MSLEAIKAILPHRPPMLLVDRIVGRTEDSITCEKDFRAEEFFFQGHYPGIPIVPGVILCEVAAQTGALLLAGKMSIAESVPVLTRLKEVKFKRMVRPGETVSCTAKISEQVGRAFYLTASVKVGEETAATLTFAVSPAPKPQ
ncbi:MAG: 3-hydroxyacyl-ACP dehydratase FabZ family protein [Pirellulaceae bacterium]